MHTFTISCYDMVCQFNDLLWDKRYAWTDCTLQKIKNKRWYGVTAWWGASFTLNCMNSASILIASSLAKGSRSTLLLYSAIEQAKDVFLCIRTGSGKSLTYEYFPVLHPGKCIVVLAPVLSVMQEQCYKLNNLGFKATFIGKDFRESGALEQGAFDFVFGSSESFINNSNWREMLKSEIYQSKLQVIAVDVAHTVTQW